MNTSKLSSPPSPRGHFIFRNWLETRQYQLDFPQRLRQEYGEIVHVKSVVSNEYFIFHPDYAKHILVTHKDKYSNQAFGQLEGARLLFGSGLFVNEGEVWQHKRRSLQGLFGHKYTTSLGPMMSDAINTMLLNWERVAQNGTPLNIDDEMKRLTFTIISKALFGVAFSEQANTIISAFNTINKYTNIENNYLSYLLPWLPTPSNRQFKAAENVIDNFISWLIAERHRSLQDKEESQSRSDMCSALMSYRDPQTGQPMTNQELRAELVTFFFDGSETIATALSWTWYLLSQHPAVAQALQSEINNAVGNRQPKVEDIRNLQTTRRILQESMRLYPPSNIILRYSLQSDEIGGYHIPANSELVIHVAVLHRHPDFWENPDTFDPERFTPERIAKRHKWAYMPFGAGPRRCIAYHFSMIEAQLILATVAQRFRLQLLPNHSVEPEAGITWRPKHGLLMKVEKV